MKCKGVQKANVFDTLESLNLIKDLDYNHKVKANAVDASDLRTSSWELVYGQWQE